MARLICRHCGSKATRTDEGIYIWDTESGTPIESNYISAVKIRSLNGPYNHALDEEIPIVEPYFELCEECMAKLMDFLHIKYDDKIESYVIEKRSKE